MKNKQTRRRFIINFSKILTSVFGIIVFGKYTSFSQFTKQNNRNKQNIVESKKEKNPKILVTYEGQFGSTGEVANVIAAELSKNNTVVIQKIENASNLNSFDKIIIGSAIQYDKWMPKATNFILTNQETLSKKQVAYFFTCLVLSKKTEKSAEKANDYANKLLKITLQIKPICIGKFAGVLNYSKMSFVQRTLAKGLFAIIGVKEGDYRDWKFIKSWTKSLFSN